MSAVARPAGDHGIAFGNEILDGEGMRESIAVESRTLLLNLTGPRPRSGVEESDDSSSVRRAHRRSADDPVPNSSKKRRDNCFICVRHRRSQGLFSTNSDSTRAHESGLSGRGLCDRRRFGVRPCTSDRKSGSRRRNKKEPRGCPLKRLDAELGLWTNCVWTACGESRIQRRVGRQNIGAYSGSIAICGIAAKDVKSGASLDTGWQAITSMELVPRSARRAQLLLCVLFWLTIGLRQQPNVCFVRSVTAIFIRS